MKLIYLFLMLLPSVSTVTVADGSIDRTAELIRKGDIHELAKDFASSVDLTIMSDDNPATAAQAESAISDFFKKNRPESVKILHRITSNPHFHYGVLIVSTSNGIFRVAFSLKSIQGHFELTEMRIESEKTK